MLGGSLLFAQLPDSTSVLPDTPVAVLPADSVPPKKVIDSSQVKPLPAYIPGAGNKLLNSTAIPVSLAVKLKQRTDNDAFFYLLSGLLLLLGIARVLYSRYFTNLFRVFFNTSLRQSQLTDQLLQARLPSLLFNLFFILCGGVYMYFLLLRKGWLEEHNPWILIAASVGLLGLLYTVKYCALKFTGWITGYKEQTNTYIFIVFLINKIIGIILLPFVILIAFASGTLINIALIVSLLVIVLMLFLRFFRSYGLLQHQLKVSRLHFFLYILGIEVLPLLLIYKGLVLLLSKNT
jgi:hypothetical protein